VGIAITERLEQLLRAGLDFYGISRFDEAARCWREAQQLDPHDPRAGEYLSALGADSAPKEPVERRANPLRDFVDGLEGQAAIVGKAEFVVLLREKRFEEALTVLYRAREAAPDNASISRGIQLLKDKLLATYLAQLGDLDAVPSRSEAAAQLLAVMLPTQDENAVLRLVDGIATVGDVLESLRTGRFLAARTLAGLVGRGVVVLRAPPARRTPPPPPPPASAPGPVHFSEPPQSATPPLRLRDAPPAPPPAPPPADDYDSLFQRATHAYLRRDLSEALALFQQCQSHRPDDKRVTHNIQKLMERMNRP
jgi:tetratricopeptide (TPR) repeat protein